MTTRNEYNAWGEQLNLTQGSTSNSIGYTGQRLDNETGLMALGNGERYYSSSYARFIQQDSVSGKPMNPQTMNRFAYANGNPNKFTDPTGHDGVVADGIKNSLTITSAGAENSWGAYLWNFGVNFVAGAAYDATNLMTGGAFGMVDRNIQKAMRGEQITVADFTTTNWYGGNQDGWNPGNFLKNEAIGFFTGAKKLVTGVVGLAVEYNLPMQMYRAYQFAMDPIGETEKRRQAANEMVAGIKQWASDLYGGITNPSEVIKAADEVGADKTAQILGEAEFDAAMIVDGGVNAVKGAKALNAMRVAKLERQAAQVAIKEAVELNVAESSAATKTSNFREYALKDNLIQTVVKDQEALLTPPLGEQTPVVGRMVDLDTGKMSGAYTNVDTLPSNLEKKSNWQWSNEKSKKFSVCFRDDGDFSNVSRIRL